MEKKTTLWGIFLLINGLVLPWHTLRFDTFGGGVVGNVQSTITGLNLAGGWLILFATIAILVLTLKEKAIANTRTAMIFLTGTIVSVFFFVGIAPLFYASHVLDPSIGILFMVLGAALLVSTQVKKPE